MSRKRRGNGEGTIYPYRDGWAAQATVGLDPETRKPVRKTVYGETRKEVQAKLEELKKTSVGASAGMTLGDALDLWLAGHKARVDPSTAIRYTQEVVPIHEGLGREQLADVTPLRVARWYAWMEARGLTASQRRRAGVRLRQCLKRCLGMQLVLTSAAEAVPLPRSPKGEICPLSVAQVGQLLRAAQGHPYEALVWIALDTGARQGELFALTWGDVDMERADIFFCKSLQERNGVLKVKQPKTPKGRRRVPITSATVEQLRRLGQGDRGDVIFRASGGGYLYRPNFTQRSWVPLLKKAGISRCRFHDLRHTCATLLLQDNVHPKVVSERLGHATIQITLDTYSHLLPTMQERAVEALSAVLRPSAV
jgi:integrase